jgi:hypothetical protein
MGSEKPPHDYCDPKITSAVDEAYEAVWAAIQIGEPVRDQKTDCERRVELSQKLASLVVDGVTDPAELRDRALASMSLETIKPANEEAPEGGRRRGF